MGRGNESLFTGSWSHDQNGHHTHIYVGSYDDPRMTTYFTERSILET